MSAVQAYLGGHRHAVVTDDDHGPILQIVTWVLMVAMVLMTLIRLATRLTTAQDIGLDDSFCILSTFMGLGNNIALSLAVNHGLGKKESARESSLAWRLQKELYSASLLYVLCICFAKISSLALITRLLPNSNQLVLVRSVIGFVSLWALTALLGDAFGCSLPHTFDFLGGHCMALFAFWNAMGAFDILTDLLIIGIAFWLFSGLQMWFGTKVVVLCTFASRIVVIGATAARLVYLNRLNHSTDPFFDFVPFLIWTQVEQVLSVAIASVPALKRFMDHTNSGMMNLSVKISDRTTYGANHHPRDAYLLTSRPKGSSRGAANPVTKWPSDQTSQVIDDDAVTALEPPLKDSGIVLDCTAAAKTTTNQVPDGVEGSKSQGSSEYGVVGETESLESQESNQMMIKMRR